MELLSVGEKPVLVFGGSNEYRGRLLGHGVWEMNVWPRSLTEDCNILCGVAGLQAFGGRIPR